MGDDRDEIQRLLSRIGLRDAVAFQSLYRLASPRLLSVAMRVLADRGLAEDVLQEVFLGVWRELLSPSPGHSKTLAWLCVITRNRAIDLLRKKKSDTPLVPLQWVDDDGEEHFHDIADESATPLAQLLAHEDGWQLGQCLSALEIEPRQAVVLAFYEGLTHLEIALRLCRPLGTIKGWTRRSLMKLKACMEAP